MSLRCQRRTSAASEPSSFDFGGTAVSVASDHRGFERIFWERYAAFATDERPRWRIRYEITDPRVPEPASIQRARGHRARASRHADRLRLETPTFALELDRATCRGTLSGPLATYPIDRLIHTLCYETRRRGLILHAAALAKGDRGYVMSGPSGSGKSTVAALLPERALCDEFVGVCLDGSSPRLAALPFWKSRRGGATLRGLYLLRHGAADRRRRLAPAEAVALLRREVVWPVYDPLTLRGAFETLFELVTAVPVWELAFRPTPEVWSLIDREAGR